MKLHHFSSLLFLLFHSFFLLTHLPYSHTSTTSTFSGNIIFFSPLLISSLGFQVRDLHRNDSCFSYDVSGWSATSFRSGPPIYTQCDSTYLLGGYGVLGTAANQMNQNFSITYSGLSSHTMVYFSLTMWAIDSWNGNADYFIIIVGSTSFVGWKNFNKNDFINNYCGLSGAGNGDLKDIRIFGRALHTGPTLTFKIMSKFDQDSTNEAMGIRDIDFILASPSPAPTEHMCGRASIPIDPTKQCSCLPGFYLDSSGTCTRCDISCASCFGPGPNQCYACKSGYSFDGTNCVACDGSCVSCHGLSNTQCDDCQPGYVLFKNSTCVPASECSSPMTISGCGSYCESPCSNPNDFLYWNGSCISTCLEPLKQATMLDSVAICTYPCPSGEYLYWDGTCSSTCPSPLWTIVEAGINYCNYPCEVTEFLNWWNGTCSSACEAPLTRGVIGGYQLCYFPCSDNEYLYWDGSCSTECGSPLIKRIEGGKNYCDYPCKKNEYLYWEGNCSSTCKYPYIKRKEFNRTFCDFPCSGTQYLYWDGTCSSSCAGNLILSSIDGKNLWKSPCKSNEYVYWNGTCSSTCDTPPFVRTFKGSVNFCGYPCNSGEFLLPNGSCFSSCKAPLTAKYEGGKAYCVSQCPGKLQLLSNGSCAGSCNFPLVYITNSSGTYCDLPCNDTHKYYSTETGRCITECSTSSVYQDGIYLRCLPLEPIVEMIELVKLLHYIRYLEIKLPPKLQLVTVIRQMNILSIRILPTMAQEAKNDIMEATQFSKHDRYDLPSSFLANFLDDLILMAIILGAGFAFMILEKMFQRFRFFRLQVICERLKVLAKWNVFIILMITNGGDIIFFSSVEFQMFDPLSITADFSLTISLIMLVGIVLVLIGNLYLIYKIQNYRAKDSSTNNAYSDYLHKWQSFQVLFRGLRENNALAHAFHFIYGLRLALPMAVAAFLSRIPILQTVFYLIISIAIILFIVLVKPINNKLDQYNLIILESLVLTANVCLFVLAIWNLYDTEIHGGHVFLGDVIIIMNMAIYYLAAIFLLIKFLAGIYKLRRYPSREKLQECLQLLFLPLQQGGLGFEQVELVSTNSSNRTKRVINQIKPRVSTNKILPQPVPRPVSTEAFTEKTSSITGSLDKEGGSETIPCTFKMDRSQMPKFKKRRHNGHNNLLQLDPDLGTIQEDFEHDSSLVHRLSNLSNVGPEISRDESDGQRAVLSQDSNVLDAENSLIIPQVSPFGIGNTGSFDRKIRRRW